jgi:Fusaric acid resistance protein-like
MFALGVGIPVVTAIARADPQAALFAGLGALIALQTDPRRTVRLRIIAICIALAAIVAAGALGAMLAHNQTMIAVAVLVIAFLAGLPKPVFPYLTLVGKVSAAAVIVMAAGFVASEAATIAFLAGGLFALVVTVLEVRWRQSNDPGMSPFDEFRAIWSGNTNPLFYAVTLAAAVALALGLGVALHAHLPGWVGLTVLFVMHPDDAMAVRLMVQRIGGTLAGVVVAWLIVFLLHSSWPLAVVVVIGAAAMPKATAAGFFWLSAVYTVVVMLLLDLALLATGGDASLLLWRLYDTILGCIAAAIVLAIVHLVRCRQWRRPPAAP